MKEKKELFILSPLEKPDVKLALETIKAGAFPILHLGRDLELAKQELIKLSSKTNESFGICIVSEIMNKLTLPKNVIKILLPFGMNISNEFLSKDIEILYQVHSLEEAEKAIENKSCSIVIKGNEGAGKVSDESSFILFQGIMKKITKNKTNVFIQGGAGLHSSSAFLGLGAKGIIFDSQVLLFSECSVSREIKQMCSKLSGGETIVIDNFRVLSRKNSPKLSNNPKYNDLLPYLNGCNLSENYIPLGQDIALSIDLVGRYKKLNNLVTYFYEMVYGHVFQAKKLQVISENNPLAKDLGVKFPIAQGPMARVSDVPEFINSVANSGALPFFALSVMTGKNTEDVLKETSELLGNKPWGIGILGFAPPKLREAQTEYILKVKPPMLIIAGGSPRLAKPFEKEGIRVFLHVPSVSLLDIFLKEGCKDFIFEGRESGGHVGPLSSLVLWEKQIVRLLEEDKNTQSVFFAGGIHDAFSSAFVSIMSVSLAAKGIKVGVLMGTSYLYTKEAIKSQSIQQEYQNQLIKQKGTVLLESAPGQITRALKSDFTEYFTQEKQQLLSSGLDSVEILMKLEALNIGRLRIASKGIERKGQELIKIDEKEQLEKGCYQAGAVTALKNKVTTLDKLHKEVAIDNNELINKLENLPKPISSNKPIDIAIIGMECIFPDAKNLDEYWKNILLNKDCISEVPDSRWNKDLFYKPDSQDSDDVVSKWGGFIPTIDFDPLEFGMTPQSMASIEPIQLLSLLVAKRALEDAGYANLSEVESDYTSVIFGAQGATELATSYSLRASAKQLFGELPDEVKNALPRLNSHSFAGVLSNVIAGRITNRLNLGGRNYSVDAACASSLAALDIGCQELISNRSDMVVLGGADLHNGLNDFLLFGSTYALSKKGYCATFDADSDGIALGEGIGILVLKRLEDAERDGNKIYSVIKGIGGSSDGKSLGMTAPSRKGQFKALERAYQNAGVTALDIGLIEAHGTGTSVGDTAELSALTDLFLESGAINRQTYLGSVKTQIGHTKCAAGLAGIIKATLSVYHGIIPATIHLNKPLAVYDSNTSPFLFNEKASLWNSERRIAGISAFGFGGTNFHAVIENYQPNKPKTTTLESLPAELLVFRGDNINNAKEQIQKINELLDINNEIKLKDIAYTLANYNDKDIQISIVAKNIEELKSKLNLALQDKTEIGIYYTNKQEGKVAFLFSGQGSQRVNMARDLFVGFPQMRRLLNQNDQYQKIIFPEATFDDESKTKQKQAITDTQNAQPILGMVDFAIAEFLKSLNIEPDMLAGHSYGELAALCFSGAFEPENLIYLSQQRALSILNAIENDKGKMLAISNVSQEDLKELLKDETQVWAVNFNSTKQIVLAGTSLAIDNFLKKMNEKNIACKEINVACAFHSPLLHKSKELYAKVLKDVIFNTPKIKVWSNTTAEIYPQNNIEIKERLAEHLIKPVLFTQQLENMYKDGARIFIEAGPGSVLTNLAKTTLGDQITAIQTEGTIPDGITFMLQAIAKYIATGRNINFEKLFEQRNVSTINIDTPEKYKKSSTIWHINGHNAVPSVGTLPKDGALPIINPIILIKNMNNNNNQGIDKERIMLEYFNNMKSLIQNQQELIQNERDVMLGYLGQFEITTAPRIQMQNIAVSPVQRTEIIQNQEIQSTQQINQSEETTSNLPNVNSLSVEEITNIILSIVSEKTGYPIDMLGMDLDLEADLSIDSIKRMEIIAALKDKINFATEMDMSEELFIKMASIKTLNALVLWIKELGESKDDDNKSTQDIQEQIELSRMCLDLNPYQINQEKIISIEGQYFALTDDGSEYAIKIKQELETKGATVSIISNDDELTQYDGLIILNISSAKKNYKMKDLFNIMKNINIKQLKSVYIFSDIIGHILNNDGINQIKNIEGFPGLIKTLAHEYPQINFGIIKSHTEFKMDNLPKIIADELSINEALPEIIYKNNERFRFEARLEKLDTEQNQTSNLDLNKDSVVLVLGGAQGITPQIVSQLANQYPCNYILVGRSSQIVDDQENNYSLMKTKDEIRQYLIGIENMKKPAEIEQKVQAIFKSNQIAESITKIENAGGKVVYKSIDIQNIENFSNLINDLKNQYTKIDGVIHAAGILDDKLFEQKTWESFQSVYLTKTNSLKVIIDKLLPELKFLVLFSSVSSAFGNKGQTDYAAANSVFDLTSFVLKQKNPNLRILSFNWGPWKGAGMVSNLLENEFNKRGVAMIPLKEGSQYFVDELKYGKETSVLVMGGKESDIDNFLQVINN